MNSVRRRIALGVAVCALLVASAVQVAAFAPSNTHFERTWARTDKPVVDGKATRTWMWGPEAFTGAMQEDYEESPGKMRTVQYFDKSRMEITNPNGNQDDIWYVTSGLLVVKMVTGRMQLGDDKFDQYFSATENVAGDEDDPTGPTYATFKKLLNVTAGVQLQAITQVVDRAGNVTIDPSKAAYAVPTAHFVGETQHWIAKPFWDFMNSSGVVYQGNAFQNDLLFQNPYYATGFPIVDPFWANVKVGGVYKDVLMQCFERRCLTYTPDNPDGWKVEAGNVGQHYYRWRYDDVPASGGNPCPVIEQEPLMYVVDKANHRIQVLNMDGEYICEWGGGVQPGGIFSPWAIHLDDNGYVNVLTSGWIQTFNPRGGFERAFPVPVFTQDFAIGADGYFYTTGQSLAKVIVYDQFGDFLFGFDGGGAKLESPTGIAVDEDGYIYTIDRGTRYATKFASDGSYATMYGGPGDPQDGDEFDIPTDITVDRFGRVYVTDSGYVKTFTYQGVSYKADGHWGGMTEQTHAGDARIFVVTDADHADPIMVYVGDTLYETIRVWTFHNGMANLTQVIGELGVGPGKFANPYGVTIAQN